MTFMDDHANFKHLGYENLSEEIGSKYLTLIESEFQILHSELLKLTLMNDSFGGPVKYAYKMLDGSDVVCSPTTLRYIYLALIILDHYKTTNCKSIIEVGSVYGGLYLMIDYFAKKNNIEILEYNLVEESHKIDVLSGYINIFKENLITPYRVHSLDTYGDNATRSDMFFISNYGITQYDSETRMRYCDKLLPRVVAGFIIWQTCACPMRFVFDIKHRTKQIVYERPQTATQQDDKNYFIYF